MPKPRVFLSSTIYDLKETRKKVDRFLKQVDYETILSEEGKIAYRFNEELDASCYGEVAHSDLYILIVNDRYGARATGEKKDSALYKSITRKEFETAQSQQVPTYIFVNQTLKDRYDTLKQAGTHPAAIKDKNLANMIDFLDDIYNQTHTMASFSIPIFTYDKESKITSLLKKQLAGLFQHYLEIQKKEGQKKAKRKLKLRKEKTNKAKPVNRPRFLSNLQQKLEISEEKLLQIVKANDTVPDLIKYVQDILNKDLTHRNLSNSYTRYKDKYDKSYEEYKGAIHG